MQEVVKQVVEGIVNDGQSGLRHGEQSSSQRSDAKRLFHGRGQCYPGLAYINVDWYEPLLLITLYQEPPEEDWQYLQTELLALAAQVDCVIVQRRYLPGSPRDILWGEPKQPVVAKEADIQYLLDFSVNQNHGFFLDMSPGRDWLRSRATNKRILNLFSYTCAFSVVAIAGSAHSVLNVDMSKAALNVGRENHRLNGQDDRLRRDVQFMAHDIFRSWKRITNQGPYDIVIIDPPSRQKGSFVATKDYPKLIRRLPSLLADKGDVLACLNAPEIGEAFIHDLFAEHVEHAHFVERLATRDDFPESDVQRNLKMLHYQLHA